ncbi:MAG TPA: cbb3-type cytochrome c oxidase subunit I, partial [Terrimicrobiaceae bacterium]|nr:cbb3-type cytochrome c oxidase subunit I [Terrimicrobiaceae bacterium]
LAQRPVRAYPSSVLAFWLLAFLGGWSGTRQLIGGPVPAWMVSASVAAGIIMLIPATIIVINTFGSLSSQASLASPVALFTVVGLGSFVCAVLQGTSTPLLAMVTHFSDYTTGEHVVILFGFLSMTLFGGLYFVVPRLTGVSFSPSGITWHFWLFVCGGGTMFLCLTLGGLIQGFALFDPGVDFSNSVSLAMPFRATSAFGALVLFASTIVFADGFIRNLLGAAVFPAAPPAPSTTKEIAKV